MLDPSIPLGYRGPDPNAFANGVQQAQSIADLLQRRQLTQQQIKASQLANQQAQQDQADSQKLKDLFSANANPTQAQVYSAVGPVKGARVSAELATAAQKGAELDKLQGESAKLENDYFGSLAGGIRAAKYSPDSIQQALQMASTVAGGRYAQHAAMIGQAIAQNPAAAPAVIDHLYSAAMSAKDQADAADKAKRTQSDIESAQAKLPGEQAKSDAAQMQNYATQLAGASDQAGYSKMLGEIPLRYATKFPTRFNKAAVLNAGMSPDQIATTGQTAARDANTAQHQKTLERIEQQNANSNSARLGLENSRFQMQYGGGGQSVYANLPDAQKAIADKLASGDFDPAQLGRYPNKEALVAAAIERNPAWSPNVYLTKKSFTNPESSQAKNLGTISRIVGHIGRYEQNSRDLGFAPSLWLGNYGGTATSLGEDTHALSGELEKLVSGGVGAEGQVRQWQSDLRSAHEDVRQKAVDEISQLVGSQYEGMQQTYKAGTGEDLPIAKYVSPAGREWMRSKGIMAGAGSSQTATAAPANAPAANPPAAAKAVRSPRTPATPGSVRMIAPDGSLADVPADQVDHYLQLGAKKAR